MNIGKYQTFVATAYGLRMENGVLQADKFETPAFSAASDLIAAQLNRAPPFMVNRGATNYIINDGHIPGQSTIRIDTLGFDFSDPYGKGLIFVNGEIWSPEGDKNEKGHLLVDFLMTQDGSIVFPYENQFKLHRFIEYNEQPFIIRVLNKILFKISNPFERKKDI